MSHSLVTPEAAIQILREHVESCGGVLELGWTAQVVARKKALPDGPRGDVYYYHPDGTTRFRSKKEVVTFLNLGDHVPAPKSGSTKPVKKQTDGTPPTPNTIGKRRGRTEDQAEDLKPPLFAVCGQNVRKVKKKIYGPDDLVTVETQTDESDLALSSTTFEAVEGTPLDGITVV
jgi:hypothetical protein